MTFAAELMEEYYENISRERYFPNWGKSEGRWLICISLQVAIKTNEFNLIKENTFLDWWSQLIKCVQPSGSFLLLKVLASVRKSKNLRIFSEKSKSSNNLSSTILGNVRWREIKDTFQDFSSQDLIFRRPLPIYILHP